MTCVLPFRWKACLLIGVALIFSFPMKAQRKNKVEWIKKEVALLGDNPDISLVLCYENHTAHAYHERYAIWYKHIPVLDRYVTVHSDSQHRILSLDTEITGIEKLKGYDGAHDLEVWKGVKVENLLDSSSLFFHSLKSSELKWEVEHEYPQLVLEAKAWSRTYDRSLLLNHKGEILKECNYERNYTDTIIQAKIFNPDPLTTIQQNYGGLYVDSNDIHQSWMNNAYQTVDIAAQFSVDSFYLKNDWVVLEELEDPIAYPVVQANGQFFFNRNETGFEDVNVLYHLTHFHDYISSLGYDTLMSMGVLVDAHAQFGADNSVFSRNGGNPTLRYGTGGVDDAEDADVIIHEYAHGLSWSANGNDNFITERSALDEGVADYFATSYSHQLASFHSDQVFNWDGHNEFWGGRKSNSNLNYPVSAGIYTIGEIWNSAMSAIWSDLGATITDKLMLESLHFFSNSTTLPQAALYVLQSDSLLFGGQFHNTICSRFQERHILDSNCKPVSVQQLLYSMEPEIRNTMAFAEGRGDVMISFQAKGSGQWHLFNIEGRKIKVGSFRDQKEIQVSPDGLMAGIYFLECPYENHLYRVKLLRY